MKAKLIHWTPRILGIGFVIFLSLFSLDVFSEYRGLDALLPLLIHLIPSLALLVTVLIAWKYDLFGAIVFLGFALFYVVMVGVNRPWSWYAGISAPTALVGILFLLSWMKKKNIMQ